MSRGRGSNVKGEVIKVERGVKVKRGEVARGPLKGGDGTLWLGHHTIGSHYMRRGCGLLKAVA